MKALQDRWTLSSRLYDRADEGSPRKFVLDSTIGWQNYLDTQRVIQPIDLTPQPSDLAGYTWMLPGLPYRAYLGSGGARRFYPDRNDLSRYIRFPANRFLANKTFAREGNSLVWRSNAYDIVLLWKASKLKLNVVIKRNVQFDSVSFDVDKIGISDTALLSYLANLKAIDSSPFPIERPLSVSLVSGVLTLGFDLSGMTLPVIIDPTLDISVGVSADDTYARRQTSTLFNTNGTGLPFGNITSTAYDYGGSMRFTGVNIPSGATIDVAYITYIAQSTQSGITCTATIAAENANNPAAPTTYDDHINRTRTASVAYDSVAAQTAGDSIQTPSAVAPIQTVVTDNGGTGSALQMFIEDIIAASSVGAWRGISSWDHATYNPPAIHIEYTAGGVAFNLERIERHYPRGVMRGGMRGAF